MDLQYLKYLRQERNLFVKLMTEDFQLNTEQKVRIENFLIAFDSVRQKYKDNDDLKQFAIRVQDMRTAQSKYFASRTQTNLDASKTLERRIDKEVKEAIKAKTPESVQTSLF